MDMKMEQWIEQLETWYQEGQYPEIIQSIEQADPSVMNDEVRGRLAVAYNMEGRYEEALKLLESMRGTQEGSWRWQYRMAFALYASDRLSTAAGYFARCLDLAPPKEVEEECWARIDEIEHMEQLCTPPEVSDPGSLVGTFVGFVLLRRAVFDRKDFLARLKREWDLEPKILASGAMSDAEIDAMMLECEGCRLAVRLMDGPIPEHEAEDNAVTNYLWPHAIEAACEHKAHLSVAVVSDSASLMARGRLFVKLMSVCAAMPEVLGLYTCGTVHDPAYYRKAAEAMNENQMPLLNWVWVGLYNESDGVSGYTCGLDVFGKDEIEVLNAHVDPGELRNFLLNTATYVLEQNADLRDGEKIGLSPEKAMPIIRSAGYAVPGVSLKISLG